MRSARTFEPDRSGPAGGSGRAILTGAYDVPPENMVVQGYGEEYLKVETDGPERANRRVALSNITPILQTAEQEQKKPRHTLRGFFHFEG